MNILYTNGKYNETEELIKHFIEKTMLSECFNKLEQQIITKFPLVKTVLAYCLTYAT